MEKMLSVKDVCEILGVTRQTVYVYRVEQGLKHYVINGRVKFKREDVEQWIKDNAEVIN